MPKIRSPRYRRTVGNAQVLMLALPAFVRAVHEYPHVRTMFIKVLRFWCTPEEERREFPLVADTDTLLTIANLSAQTAGERNGLASIRRHSAWLFAPANSQDAT